MGGRYPTSSSGWGSPVAATVSPVPDRDFRPVWPTPARDPYNPRRFLRPEPKYPWRPPGWFPNGWKPPKTIFGRKPPITVFPTYLPSRFPRVLPWASAIPLAAILFAGKSPSPANFGFTLCFDIGGDKSMGSGGANFCNLSLAGQSFQPGGPRGAIYLGPNTQTRKAIFYGSPDNVQLTRMTHREMWVRDPNTGIPHLVIPYFPWPIRDPFPSLDWDPNFWLPATPQVYVPVPNPVWRPVPNPASYPVPREVGNTYPQPISSPVPSPAPVTPPVPRVEITPKGIRWDHKPHRRSKPKKRERENKYTAGKGGVAFMAAWALRVASKGYGGITELVEMLAAIYAALPDDIIARRPDFGKVGVHVLVQEMMSQIIAHHDKIDFTEAVHNLAVNGVEDWIYGKYFKAMSEVSKRGPYMEGFGREYGYLNEAMLEMMKEKGLTIPPEAVDVVWWLRNHD